RSIPADLRGTTAVPLRRTLEQLAALADVRGDAADGAVLRRAASLVHEHSIETDADLGPFLESPPAPVSDFEREVMRRLQYMYDAGAWVLRESAIADLPTDLRWLFESGAVTIDQLAALHAEIGV